jgi:hypothetical protein
MKPAFVCWFCFILKVWQEEYNASSTYDTRASIQVRNQTPPTIRLVPGVQMSTHK